MNRFILQLCLATFFCGINVFASEAVLECTQVVEAGDKQVTLKCPLVSGEVRWFKDGKAIAADDKKYVVDASNRTLVIARIDKTVSGEFECSAAENETKVLTVCVRPHVEQYDKPKNVIEGDPFQSDCVAWGYPTVKLEWTHEKNFTGAEDRTSFKNGSSSLSTLRIEKVQYEDSGYYTCTARNDLGARNATIQVNVKDKLAALWPFLGICAEVAILCIIIFFYERRRAKNLEKEALQSEETDRMTANNDSKVSEEVRHRK